jgi:hypothetical protein
MVGPSGDNETGHVPVHLDAMRQAPLAMLAMALSRQAQGSKPNTNLQAID